MAAAYTGQSDPAVQQATSLLLKGKAFPQKVATGRVKGKAEARLLPASWQHGVGQGQAVQAALSRVANRFRHQLFSLSARHYALRR